MQPVQRAAEEPAHVLGPATMQPVQRAAEEPAHVLGPARIVNADSK